VVVTVGLVVAVGGTDDTVGAIVSLGVSVDGIGVGVEADKEVVAGEVVAQATNTIAKQPKRYLLNSRSTMCWSALPIRFAHNSDHFTRVRPYASRQPWPGGRHQPPGAYSKVECRISCLQSRANASEMSAGPRSIHHDNEHKAS
jgi:hypothetical protein